MLRAIKRYSIATTEFTSARRYTLIIQRKAKFTEVRSLSSTRIRQAQQINDNEITIKLINEAKYEAITNNELIYQGIKELEEMKQQEGDSVSMDRYNQLPDDSRFIEKYHVELETIKRQLGIPFFNSFSGPIELFEKLAELSNIEVIVPKKFIIDLIILLKLNGGYLFILDIMIKNFELFNKFEKQIKKD